MCQKVWNISVYRINLLYCLFYNWNMTIEMRTKMAGVRVLFSLCFYCKLACGFFLLEQKNICFTNASQFYWWPLKIYLHVYMLYNTTTHNTPLDSISKCLPFIWFTLVFTHKQTKQCREVHQRRINKFSQMPIKIEGSKLNVLVKVLPQGNRNHLPIHMKRRWKIHRVSTEQSQRNNFFFFLKWGKKRTWYITDE